MKYISHDMLPQPLPMPTSIEQTVDHRHDDAPGVAGARGELHSLSLLCVASREPAWTNLTLQLDAHGCQESRFRWVSTVMELLAALRDETFDCLLIADALTFDAFAALRAVRTGGHSDPAVLLAPQMTDERWLAALQLRCSVLTSPRAWESRALVPMLRSELRRSELERDNHRLAMDQHRRLLRERDETEHLLDQQRQILGELRGLVEIQSDGFPSLEYNDDPVPQHAPPPDVLSRDEVVQFYDELLRTYVMMGSGRLSAEIARLAELLAAARVSPRDALGMHLQRVEALVGGLGSRSSRHVLSRADLLALELTIQLGECYREG